MSADVRGGRASPHLANGLLLIVNEFVSNSVKHGLTDAGGRIEFVITTAEDQWSIVCKDNGSADTKDAALAASASGLGTRVINSLANSLGASLDWRASGHGMELRLASLAEA